MSWAAVAGAAASVIGGVLSNKSASKSANAQIAGLQKGADTINQYYKDAQGYMQPYMDTGGTANNGIQKLLGGDFSGFYNAPDFQARLKAGTDMFDSSAAARGGVFGGGATRGREMYAQGLAAQGLGEYRDWLGNVAGQGQAAATNLGQLGMGAGNSLANLYSGMGQARGSSYAQQGANNANMLGSIGGMFGSLFGGK